MLKTRNGRMPIVKILADKEIKKSFVFENVKMSEKVKVLAA